MLLEHCFALVAPEQAADAAINWEMLEIGRFAVDVFFIISGFLVTRSVLTQPTLVDYGVARVLRLFPTLVVTCILIAFLLGPLVTTVPLATYFTDPRTWLYVPVTASLITHAMTLPGVFDSVPVSGVIDSPLWTLCYEAACYLLLAVFALAGGLASRSRATVTLALVFLFYLFVTFATPWRAESAPIDSTARFVLGFFVGGALYIFADKVKLSLGVAVVLALIAVVSYRTPLYEMALRAATVYGVVWFALVPSGPIRRFNLIGDYSYGIYILCFPIQQTLVLLHPEITPLRLLLVSFPLVLALAILSWHFIEHPSLRQKAWAGDSVGSLLRIGQQRITTFLGLGAAPKPEKSGTDN